MGYECICDYDAPSYFSSRPVKAARRVHRCYECGCRIDPGDPYMRNEGSWYPGEHASYKWCQHCTGLWQWARISVPCFCWEFGNLHENIADMVSDVRHQVPGFFFEYGRRVIAAKRARKPWAA